MQLVAIQNLKKEFTGEVLFDNINFTINDKDRVALVGNNGCGKSTLLKMLINKEEVTGGVISLAKNTQIGYLSQDVIENKDNTLYEEAINIFAPLIEKEKELEKLTLKLAENPNDDKLIELYGKKQQYFTSIGGYDYHYKIEMMISKFGFTKDDYNRKISTFSGGERTKIAFAKLLLIEPNLLILDEPTNHLDLSTMEWLETYLKTYNGALLFVSHDRYFIEKLANVIVEIENKTSFSFKGNYERFIEVKKEIYDSNLRQYNHQQQEIERMKKFIEYYRYKPRFVSRVHDREKKLERLNKIDKPYEAKTHLKLSFQGEAIKGKKIFDVEDLFVGFSTPLIEHINFSLFGQDKIAIMGDNGSGKTTLLRVIMEELKPLKGNIYFKRQVKIGYIDQHHLDIKGNETILENMMNDFPTLGEKNLRNHLGKFGFVGDDYQKELDMLSGGEKMRFVLAKIILRNYDLLLLDEPTNHLDMLTRQALINALNDYQGTIIFVSHDRYFVDEIATHVLYIANSKMYFNVGGYQEFLESKKDIIEQDTINQPVVNEIKSKEKTSNSSLKVEEKITSIENKLKELKANQFLEEYYMDYEKSKKLENDIAALEKELKELEEKYLL